MKRGSDLVIILLLISFLSVGLSSAASCRIAPLNGAGNCTNPTTGPGERIVMGLSDVTNAHGQVWNATAYNQSVYPYVLCCDFYAGLGTSPYACSSTLNTATGQPINKILGLSDVTNAHSEAPNFILYKTNVCYGSLTCRSSTTGCDASVNETNILNLSSQTNAHIGTGAGFNVSICCKDTSNAIGKNCALNASTWEDASTLEGGQVKMIIQGANCPVGTSVNYSVWKQGALSNTIVSSYIDYFNNLTWIAKLPTGTTGTTNFIFQAQAMISKSSFSSSSGTGNKTLSVSPQPLGFCNGISLCSDYKDQQNCTSDRSLCSPPRAQVDPNCNPINKQSCQCMWSNGKCSLSTSYSATTQSCNNGFNLCYNSTMGMYYCYPNASCPVGDATPTNAICDISDGCYSIDCNGLSNPTASCAGGATCSAGICKLAGQAPKNVSTCDSGYTLCYNGGLDFCYPAPSTIVGATCRVGESPLSNNNSICDPGDGCSSSDCGGMTGGDPNKTDSCAVGAYCLHGACFSPNAAIGKCLLTTTTTNCTDAQRIMHTTVTWVGVGNAPASCQNSSHPDKVIPCAAQIELPFFGIYQVAGAIVLLIVIYLLYAFRKKIFKKHHSRKRK